MDTHIYDTKSETAEHLTRKPTRPEVKPDQSSNPFGKMLHLRRNYRQQKTGISDDEMSLVDRDESDDKLENEDKMKTLVISEAEVISDGSHMNIRPKSESTPPSGTESSRLPPNVSVENAHASELLDIDLFNVEITSVPRVANIVDNEKGQNLGVNDHQNEEFQIGMEELHSSDNRNDISKSSVSEPDIQIVCEAEARTVERNYKTQSYSSQEDSSSQYVDKSVDVARGEMLPKSQWGKRGTKNKKHCKKMRKKRKKKVQFEAIAEDEASFQSESHCGPTDKDPDTIEILERDPEVKKEKRKKRKRAAKRIVKKAGVTVWKGIRAGCRLMWSGLAMYTLPLGSLDVGSTVTKIWSANSTRPRGGQF